MLSDFYEVIQDVENNIADIAIFPESFLTFFLDLAKSCVFFKIKNLSKNKYSSAFPTMLVGK